MAQQNPSRPRLWCLFVFLSVNVVVQTLGYTVVIAQMLHTSTKQLTLSGVSMLALYVAMCMLGIAALLAALAVLLSLGGKKGWRLVYVLWSAVQTFVIGYLAVDFMVFRIMGLHLESSFVLEAVLNAGFQKEAQISTGTWILLAAGIGFLFWLQMTLLRKCLALAPRTKRLRPRLEGAALALGIPFALALCATIYSWPTLIAQHPKVADALPLYQLWSRVQANAGAGRLKVKYPTGAARTQLPTLQKKHNIIYIMVESLRSDMLDSRYMPHATRFIERHNCVRSKRHYSGGHSTTWGVFSMLYGLHSYHMKFFYNENITPYPLKLLKHNGYQLEGYSASRLHGWDHGEMFGQQFDNYREVLGGKSYQNDHRLIGMTHSFYKRMGTKPFFLFLFLDSTHHNYLYPKKFGKFQPTMPENYNHFMVNHKLRKLKPKIFNRYKNSVGYIDHVFSRLMKALEPELKRKNLVVALVGDHGEEFWDHGLLGHGAPRMINARTQVPLVLCMPNIKSRTVPVSGHADIWPTVLDNLSPKPALKPSEFSSGRSLLRPLPKNHYAVTTSYGFPYKNRRLGVVTQTQKLWVEVKGALDRVQVTKITDLKDKPRRTNPQVQTTVDTLKEGLHRFLRPTTKTRIDVTKIEHRVGASFGPYLELLGYDLGTKTLTSGQTLRVAFYFKVNKKIPKPWQLFVHLTYQKGTYKDFRNLQYHSIDGKYALTLWRKGQLLKEYQRVPIPREWRAGGTVKLRFGMWASKRGRQPITLAPTAPRRPVRKRSLELFGLTLRAR